MKKVYALANSADADGFALALDNDSAIDEDGWGLIAPFGEWPKTQQVRQNGQIINRKFIQVLDNESADAMVDQDHSFFRKIGKLMRISVGIPIYKGHGDLTDVVPNAVPNTAEKIKIGVVDKIRKTARGIEAHFNLDNDGAKAVQEEDYRFPSAFWHVAKIGERDGAILAKPFKLISVALTPYPNIRGVESLANARSQIAPPVEQNENIMKDQLIGLLIGRGAKLPANPTNEQLMAAVTALGNDMADGDGDEASASAKAHRASANAAKKNDKDSHLKAAVAHHAAADTTSDDDTKNMHGAMAKYHTGQAANC